MKMSSPFNGINERDFHESLPQLLEYIKTKDVDRYELLVSDLLEYYDAYHREKLQSEPYELNNELVSTTVEKLYLNEELSDVNFVFRTGEKLPASKVHLGIFSPVFQSMFFGPVKEKGDVEIVDVSAEGFKEFLQLFYFRKVQLDVENMDEILYLTDKYLMLNSLSACAASRKHRLTPNNMCCRYRLAIMLNNEELVQLCETKIKAHALAVFKSNDFLRCNRNVFQRILSMDYLLCDEWDVYKACLNWAKSACNRIGLDGNNGANLRMKLGDCLQLVRYSAMSVTEFFKLTPEGLFTNYESIEIVNGLCRGENNVNIELSEFNQKPRSGEFEWNDDMAVVCCYTDNTVSVSEKYHICREESVFFSTNHPALLGEFCIVALERIPDEKEDEWWHDWMFKIQILEEKDEKYPPKVMCRKKQKVVHHQQTEDFVKNEATNIKLSPPLAITPGKMYEIRVNVVAPAFSGLYHTHASCSELSVSKEITIKFHNQCDVDNITYGLILRSKFNIL